ncbi:MAG: ABC transporter permease [Pyrinomonadaceae bacterium]
MRQRLVAVWESFAIALASLRASKLRTSLTLLGIIVGVTAVIAVVTIIKGLDQTVASTFSSQGSTVFTVSKRPRLILSREDFIKFNKRKDVNDDDAQAILRLCTGCWRAGIGVNTGATVKHGDQKSEGVGIRGVTTSLFVIEDINVETGRSWTETESSAARDVCVVGADILENLFGGAAPERVIGQTIWAGGRLYEIVGVVRALRQDLRLFPRQLCAHSLPHLPQGFWARAIR